MSTIVFARSTCLQQILICPGVIWAFAQLSRSKGLSECLVQGVSTRPKAPGVDFGLGLVAALDGQERGAVLLQTQAVEADSSHVGPGRWGGGVSRRASVSTETRPDEARRVRERSRKASSIRNFSDTGRAARCRRKARLLSRIFSKSKLMAGHSGIGPQISPTPGRVRVGRRWHGAQSRRRPASDLPPRWCL